MALDSEQVCTRTRRNGASVARRLKAPALILGGAVLLQLFAALSPRLVEQLYSRRLFPRLAAALAALSRPFPFSLAEPLLACAAILAAALLCRRLMAAARPPESCEPRRRRIAHLSADLCVGAAWAVSVCAAVFMLVFGLNYERRPLAQTLGYEERRATADELEPLAAEVIEAVNRSYEESHAPGAPAPEEAEIARAVEESYERLAAALPGLVPAGGYSAPKPAALSAALTRAGISGVYFPLTGEANYNRLMPDFQRPFTMAHEMAHQRGFARESEANFIAFLVCAQSPHPFVRYSGFRNGLGLLAELRRAAPERARELSRRLGPGYRADTERAYRFWSRGAGRLGSFSESINDLYLRANLVRSGVGNYSESTALLVGYYRQRNRQRTPAPGAAAAGGS